VNPGALERCLDELWILRREWHEQLARPILQREIASREIRLKDRRIRLLFQILQELVLAREQLASSNAHQRDGCVVAVTSVAKDVAITAVDREDDRRFLHALEMLKRVAQFGRPLEIQRLGGELHALANTPRDLLRASLENYQHLVDHRAILALRLRENTRRLTALDVIIEARPLRHLPRHVEITRAHGEDPLHDVECAAHRTDIGIWTEVPAPVVDQMPSHPHTRERLSHRDLDVRV
jgi:hypothetical protein